MAIECSWYGWIVISKICFTARIVSMIITIWVTSCIWVAWLLPHLIAKSSALVNIIFII